MAKDEYINPKLEKIKKLCFELDEAISEENMTYIGGYFTGKRKNLKAEITKIENELKAILNKIYSDGKMAK